MKVQKVPLTRVSYTMVETPCQRYNMSTNLSQTCPSVDNLNYKQNVRLSGQGLWGPSQWQWSDGVWVYK